MAGIKYSRQREAIITYLQSAKDHPTAEMVYEKVRETDPRISLGTVYRNLNLLVEHGDICRLCCGDGMDHFDATTAPHYHFICSKCGGVMDLDLTMKLDIDKMAADGFDGEVKGHQLYFYGVCKSCLNDIEPGV